MLEKYRFVKFITSKLIELKVFSLWECQKTISHGRKLLGSYFKPYLDCGKIDGQRPTTTTDNDIFEKTPVNTSVNTSLNTPVNTSVNTPVNTSVNAPVNAPVTTSGNTSMNMSMNTPVNTSVNTSVNTPVPKTPAPTAAPEE